MTRLLLTAGLLCAVAAVPVHAAPVDAGRPCEAQTTGLRDSHLGHQEGVLSGGPWVVAGGRDVTVTCVIAYSAPDCYEAPASTVSGVPRGTVAFVGPFVFEFWNPFAQAVYLGTEIRWTEADGTPGEHRVDVDAGRPGDQCAVLTWGNEG